MEATTIFLIILAVVTLAVVIKITLDSGVKGSREYHDELARLRELADTETERIQEAGFSVAGACPACFIERRGLLSKGKKAATSIGIECEDEDFVLYHLLIEDGEPCIAATMALKPPSLRAAAIREHDNNLLGIY